MNATKPERPRPLHARLWATLASMKFAIWLLILLAVISVLGLFLGEFLPDNPRQSSWAEFVWTKLGQQGMKFLRDIGITRPFHAPWYRFLIGLLALSLLVCLIQRFPAVLRRLKAGPAHLDKDAILSLPLHATISGISRETLARNWPARFNRREESSEAGNLWRGEWGKYARLGPPLAHFGMFLLAVGAFLASLGGRRLEIGAFPGETIASTEIPFELRVDGFRVEYYPLAPGQTVLVGGQALGRTLKRERSGFWLVQLFGQGGTSHRVELPEEMLKNRFDPEFDSGNIRDYIASVSVFEDGQVVRRGHIEVNHPLRHKGWRVYQSSYEPSRPRVAASLDSAFVEVSLASDSSVVDTVAIPFIGEARFGGRYSLRILGFYPDYRRATGEDYSLSADMNNPAVRLQILENGEPLDSTVLFRNFDFHGAMKKQVPFFFRLLDIQNPTAVEELRTVLQFRKEQGGEVIWAGFLVMTLGLLLAFYIIHRQLWVWIEPTPEGRMQAAIGAESERGAHHFEREFEAIVSRMKERTDRELVSGSSQPNR
ncbi:MAG: cytochrome c biogenesis protein ResB [Calditrichaeota bacterium]|nr:cytochrome c biogenesis protein ResB [Calditrichota bacterium]